MTRIRYVISFNRRDGKWYASVKGVENIDYPTQKAAIAATAKKCRAAAKRGVLSQLVVKARDGGRIREERTYGADPRRYPG